MHTFLHKRILIFSMLLCSCFVFGQNPEHKKLEIAIDSMIANPNYSYQLLSELVQNKNIHDSIKARARLNMGNYFNSIGVADSSLFYTRNSLIHLREKKYLAKAYRILGSAYRIMGNNEDAMNMLFKSLNISEEINYSIMMSAVKSDLGILYAGKQDYDKSLQYLKESIIDGNEGEMVYGNYVNIGTIYFLKEDYDNAEKYFLEAFELYDPKKDPKVSATISLNIGSVLQEKKQYREAEAYFEKSKQIADANGFEHKSLKASLHSALLLDALGKHEQAIIDLQKILTKANKISSQDLAKEILKELPKIYEKTGNFKLANSYLKQFHKLEDSINSQEQQKKISELEVKYETSKKEKEILTLKEDQLVKNEEIKRQRLLKKSFVIGFLIILIPIIGLLLVYYQKLQVKNKYNAQKEEIDKQKISSFLKEQELKLTNTYALAQNEERSRIARELHDSIGGNLAAIKLQMMNINKNKDLKDTIVDQLDNTYQQVREISHNLIPKNINQTAFTNYISDYIHTIEKVTDPNITFVPHPREKINNIDDQRKVEIFGIIQELLTNSLKHAKAKVIEICLNAYKDSIEILFEDDGIGFDQKQVVKGIGLQNIRNRLKLLKAHMDIDTAINRGTAIRIQIPLNHDNQN